jgi:hypothetical protein
MGLALPPVGNAPARFPNSFGDAGMPGLPGGWSGIRAGNAEGGSVPSVMASAAAPIGCEG